MQTKGHKEAAKSLRGTTENPTALLGQFAGFLAENENIPRSKAPGLVHSQLLFTLVLNMIVGLSTQDPLTI